jgi:hypothetical protein
VVSIGADAHEGGDGGDVVALGELAELVGGVAKDDAAARVEHGALGALR